MKLMTTVLLIFSLGSFTSESFAISKPPQLWSYHKQMDISAKECAIRGHRALKVLGFSSIVKKDNYVYGNFLDNRAAVKCASLEGGSFLYLAVAGEDKNIVEKLRNELSRNVTSLSKVIVNGFIPLTASEIELIDKGYRLFLAKIFSGQFSDGFYTDPNKESKVLDFWSNGKWAKYDRNDDGHHETIFQLTSKRLIYVGSLGKKGTFIDVGAKYKKFLNKPFTEWHKYQKGRSKKSGEIVRIREI